MIKNSLEYREAVRDSYNERLKGFPSPLSFQNWQAAFEVGFDAKEDAAKAKKQEKESASFIGKGHDAKEW